METLIMYFLMWEAEIDMGEWSEAVTHASEYQHLSHAVNNDSTAALCLLVKPPWSLRESCQGNGEWNKSTVACQEGWLGGWGGGGLKDKRPGVYRANIQICCQLCAALNGHVWTRRQTRGFAAIQHFHFLSGIQKENTAIFFQVDEKLSLWLIKKCAKKERSFNL